MRIVLGFVLLFLVAATGYAGVFKWVGPDGKVIYSDRPREGAEEVNLPALQTFSLPAVPERPAEEEAPGFPGYTEFAITTPANDATLRDNQGNISIRLKLSPGLLQGHTIDVYMDGQSLGGGGRSTSLSLSNVDRGTHVLHAAVTDEKGKEVARTPSVTFHLHRQSRL